MKNRGKALLAVSAGLAAAGIVLIGVGFVMAGFDLRVFTMEVDAGSGAVTVGGKEVTNYDDLPLLGAIADLDEAAASPDAPAAPGAPAAPQPPDEPSSAAQEAPAGEPATAGETVPEPTMLDYAAHIAGGISDAAIAFVGSSVSSDIVQTALDG